VYPAADRRTGGLWRGSGRKEVGQHTGDHVLDIDDSTADYNHHGPDEDLNNIDDSTADYNNHVPDEDLNNIDDSTADYNHFRARWWSRH
jgi:hypothetical protein